jgi:PKD repeat protein
MVGVDGAGHSISETVTIDLPAIQPGIDFVPPTATITTIPAEDEDGKVTGTTPFVIIFDASESYDNEAGDASVRIASYAWDFGDETTGANITENHSYATPGSYSVTLTVTDFYGNTGYDTVTIIANEPKAPTAKITTVPDPAEGNAPLTIYFDAYKSYVDPDCGFECEIVSYKWNFGDGSTSGTGVSTTHTFDTAGTYVATLTVTDSNGKEGYDTVIITAEEPAAPTAKIITTPSPATGSAPFAVVFDASESAVSEEVASCCSIVGYSWDFGDGTTGTGIIITHTYNTVGLYPVILAVTDSNGKIGFDTVVVTVN